MNYTEKAGIPASNTKRQPTKPKKRRRGRPTRSNEELLDLALDLFLENGFEGTSIDAITAAAGMAKRTVYQRYGDKMTLFKAALKRAIEEWIVPVEQLQTAESENLEECLLRIGRILIANILRPSGLRLLRITYAESGRLPEIGIYSHQQGTGPTVAYLSDLFRRRLGPEVISGSAAEEAAQFFLHLVVGGPASMTSWGIVFDEVTLERYTHNSVRLFLHGLLPQQVGALSEDQSTEELEQENLRLKKLLVESMLRVSELQERLDVS